MLLEAYLNKDFICGDFRDKVMRIYDVANVGSSGDQFFYPSNRNL